MVGRVAATVNPSDARRASLEIVLPLPQRRERIDDTRPSDGRACAAAARHHMRQSPRAGTDWSRARRRSSTAASARRARASRARARSARARPRCPGSTASAKRRLASVYSWPQYTRVAAGKRRELRQATPTSGLGVPSNSRPQPAANSVSPQNSSGSSPDVLIGDMPGRVAGNVEHRERDVDARHVDAVAFAERVRAPRNRFSRAVRTRARRTRAQSAATPPT